MRTLLIDKTRLQLEMQHSLKCDFVYHQQEDNVHEKNRSHIKSLFFSLSEKYTKLFIFAKQDTCNSIYVKIVFDQNDKLCRRPIDSLIL
ncbi:hypothetical protein HZS_5533 [Henneguya salminicola]|nr:hypothetical protein HZS_5533 [Henneguya salminicola]